MLFGEYTDLQQGLGQEFPVLKSLATKGKLDVFYCVLQNTWLPATALGSPWTRLTISVYLWSISNVPALYYISVITQAILLCKSQSTRKHCSTNAAFCYPICCWEEIQENITNLCYYTWPTFKGDVFSSGSPDQGCY